MELSEALYTTRAMRRVAPDPVPESVVAAMMDAAVRAPSGGNTQDWRWLTVTDPDVKGALGPLYREAWDELGRTLYAGRREAAEDKGDTATIRVMKSADWLAAHFEEVPLWVLAFSRNDPSGASIYPAVWNLMLAARGEGIGTCLTTVLGFLRGPQVFEVLGVPSDKGWTLNAAISAGYPLGRWGVATREPAQHVTYAERWGEPVRWAVDEPLWHG